MSYLMTNEDIFAATDVAVRVAIEKNATKFVAEFTPRQSSFIQRFEVFPVKLTLKFNDEVVAPRPSLLLNVTLDRADGVAKGVAQAKAQLMQPNIEDVDCIEDANDEDKALFDVVQNALSEGQRHSSIVYKAITDAVNDIDFDDLFAKCLAKCDCDFTLLDVDFQNSCAIATIGFQTEKEHKEHDETSEQQSYWDFVDVVTVQFPQTSDSIDYVGGACKN